jgi:hypothetical protein
MLLPATNSTTPPLYMRPMWSYGMLTYTTPLGARHEYSGTVSCPRLTPIMPKLAFDTHGAHGENPSDAKVFAGHG